MTILRVMNDAARFRHNSPPIIQETIEQETIMVNLETGSYYSLNPVATCIWSAIEGGSDTAEIPGVVAQRFSVDVATADPDVRAFIDRLVEHELIVPRNDDASAGPPADDAADSALPYEAPVLHHYTDMQELLLLDPVHEVDAAGWPAKS